MKIFKRVVLLLILLVVVCGALFYWKPIWVGDQQLHYAMWRAGARRHSVNLPEGRIRYFEQAAKDGDGVPLLIIHGLSGRGEDFAALMPKFAALGYHVYVPDLLGYGESDKPADSDYSIATEEHIVTEFMDAVHVPRAYVVGWSMGGWIALKLALDSPQRVERLAVYDSAGIVFDSHVDISLMAPKDSAAVVRLIRAMSPTLPIPPEFVKQAIIRRLGAMQWVVERSLASMHSGRDLVDFKLASMKPPLLIVFGAEDALIPPSVGENMHKLDPRSMYVTVEGCGHFTPVECSATTAKITGEFFKAQQAMVGGELKLAK